MAMDELLEEINDRKRDLEMISKDYYLQLYKERYGDRIYLCESGYIRFKDSDNLLHRYIYGVFYPNFNKSYDVHHIDVNSYNNEIWNLMALPTLVHRNVSHGRITYGNWNSGIEELKRIGFSEEDFPKYVRKRLEIR